MTRSALVIGAGPAGSMAAYTLARAGVDVLLVDKASFPRDKVCGCCLNQVALNLLTSVGITEFAGKRSSSLHELRLSAGNRIASLALPEGLAISRARLDTALIEAATTVGAQFLSDTQARVQTNQHETPESKFKSVSLKRGDKTEELIQVRVVIVADGLGGLSLQNLPEFKSIEATNSLIGAGTIIDTARGFGEGQGRSADYENGIIYMAVGKGGYVGLVKLDDGRIDVAAAMSREAVKAAGGPAALACEIIGSSAFPVPCQLLDCHWHGTVPLTRARTKVAGDRVLVVGDSALYVEPFTGEGISWALRTGLAASKLVIDGFRDNSSDCWEPDMVSKWSNTHEKLIGNRNLPAKITASILRRPKICRQLIGVLNLCPWVTSPVMSYVNGVTEF